MGPRHRAEEARVGNALGSAGRISLVHRLAGCNWTGLGSVEFHSFPLVTGGQFHSEWRNSLLRQDLSPPCRRLLTAVSYEWAAEEALVETS